MDRLAEFEPGDTFLIEGVFWDSFHGRGFAVGRGILHEVDGRRRTEYWIPAESLAEFNRHILGKIEVVAEFRATGAVPSGVREEHG